MKALITPLLIAVLLSGCSGKGGLVPVSDVSINKAGDVIETTAGYTKDASIAKEIAVLNAHNTRTLVRGKAYKNEGFKMEWVSVEKTVFYPGMKEPITIKEAMPKVSYKAPLQFNQPLPMEPSKHPVWEFAGKVADGAFSLGGTFVKWSYGSDVVKSAWDRSAPQYNGDYNYNPQTAEPYIVNPVVVE
jgi:hypothetical protein